MMTKIINWAVSLFKKEEEAEMPKEYIVVDYSEEAKKMGLEGDEFKEITIVTDDTRKKGVYPYSSKTLMVLEKTLELPVLPMDKIAKRDEALPTISTTNPWEISYKTTKKQ